MLKQNKIGFSVKFTQETHIILPIIDLLAVYQYQVNISEYLYYNNFDKKVKIYPWLHVKKKTGQFILYTRCDPKVGWMITVSDSSKYFKMYTSFIFSVIKAPQCNARVDWEPLRTLSALTVWQFFL